MIDKAVKSKRYLWHKFMEEWPIMPNQNFGSGFQKNKIPDFDPYTMLTKRKEMEDQTGIPDVASYNQEDIEELESFCKKYGILGFNFGRMNPKLALRMLKSRMGIPLEDNVSENKIKTLLKG